MPSCCQVVAVTRFSCCQLSSAACFDSCLCSVALVLLTLASSLFFSLASSFRFGLASSFFFCQDAVNIFAQHWGSAFNASLLGHGQLLPLCPASLHELHAKQEVSEPAGEGPGCSSSSRQSVWPRAGRPCWKPVCRCTLAPMFLSDCLDTMNT